MANDLRSPLLALALAMAIVYTSLTLGHSLPAQAQTIVGQEIDRFQVITRELRILVPKKQAEAPEAILKEATRRALLWCPALDNQFERTGGSMPRRPKYRVHAFRIVELPTAHEVVLSYDLDD